MEALVHSGIVSDDGLARRFVVTGRVQGVGYRNFVEHAANRIGVRGFVRNRRDGSVEVLASGTGEQLKQLRQVLEKGPMMARVDHVVEEPGMSLAGSDDTFRIKMTE